MKRGQDIDGEAAEDNSGEAISISADGSILAIGAQTNNPDSKQSAGHVRVYKYNNGNNQWSLLGEINGESAHDRSGSSVSISADGSRIAIGAMMNRQNRGHVRVFEAVDSTAPSFQSAATNAAGNKIILTYDEALSATAAASSAFTVQTAGTNNQVTAVAISGSKVQLTLTNTVKNDDAVTVRYDDPTGGNDNNAVQDAAGNDAASLGQTAVTNNSTVAGTPPTFQSAATNAPGSKIILTYDEALSATTAAASTFIVQTTGANNPITNVNVAGRQLNSLSQILLKMTTSIPLYIATQPLATTTMPSRILLAMMLHHLDKPPLLITPPSLVHHLQSQSLTTMKIIHWDEVILQG